LYPLLLLLMWNKRLWIRLNGFSIAARSYSFLAWSFGAYPVTCGAWPSDNLVYWWSLAWQMGSDLGPEWMSDRVLLASTLMPHWLTWQSVMYMFSLMFFHIKAAHTISKYLWPS